MLVVVPYSRRWTTAHPTLCAGPTTVLEIGVGRRAAAACTLYLYHVHVPAASRPHLVTLFPAAQAPVTLHTKHGILAFDNLTRPTGNDYEKEEGIIRLYRLHNYSTSLLLC